MARTTGRLERVSALIDRALDIDMPVSEDSDALDLDRDLAATVLGLLDEAHAMADGIGADFESDTATDDGTLPQANGDVAVLRAIGAEISNALARQEIADLAFVGRAQLTEARRAIKASGGGPVTWALLGHCETGLRRARKALVALESAMREFHGLEPLKRAWESIADALEIRRVYGQFRRSIDRIGGEGLPIRDALERAAQRIAILRDRAIYPYLRIEDRREIHAFQKRIQSWSALADDDQHRRDGARMWQDLVAFAGLLGAVNRREAVRAHDRKLIADTLPIVTGSSAGLPPQVREDLQRLLGRDDELDELLLDPLAADDAGPWQRPLARLLDELDRPFRDRSVSRA